MKDTDWQILSELYKNPNITRVAERLYKTQSAITKRLQSMEEGFGTRIVERTSKGLVFTETGAFLAKQAEKYLRLEEETRQGLRDLQAAETQSMVIGSAYTYTKYSLDQVLRPFSAKHPQVSYRIVNKQSDLLHDMLLSGEIDAAFIRSDYYKGVNRILVDYTQAYCVTREPIALSMLPRLTRVGYQTNDLTNAQVAEWWEDCFGTPLPAVSVDAGYIEFAFRNVLAGNTYMLCFLPDNFVNEYGLCLTPLIKSSGSPVMRRSWFIYPQDKRRSALMEEFIRYVETEVAVKDACLLL